MQKKRALGRPAGSGEKVGSQKIIEGMQAALRALHYTDMSRIEIARHANVTPALVTYYYPERDVLFEAATLPILYKLVSKVENCLSEDISMKSKLSRAVDVILEFYARDAAIIQHFAEYRAVKPNPKLPDILGDLELSVISFFERWLMMHPGDGHDAKLLHKLMVGMCKGVADLEYLGSANDAVHDAERVKHAEMICDILSALIEPCCPRRALPVDLPRGRRPRRPLSGQAVQSG